MQTLLKKLFGRGRARAIALLDSAVEEHYAFEHRHHCHYTEDQRRTSVAQRWQARLYESRLGRLPKDCDALVAGALTAREENAPQTTAVDAEATVELPLAAPTDGTEGVPEVAAS